MLVLIIATGAIDVLSDAVPPADASAYVENPIGCGSVVVALEPTWNPLTSEPIESDTYGIRAENPPPALICVTIPIAYVPGCNVTAIGSANMKSRELDADAVVQPY
jgi:hypothetical protein